MGCYKIKNDGSISGREYKYVQWALLILNGLFLALRVVSAQDDQLMKLEFAFKQLEDYFLHMNQNNKILRGMCAGRK